LFHESFLKASQTFGSKVRMGAS